MPKTKINVIQIGAELMFSDYYAASGQAAAGEFVTTIRKTYDITSIPTGHSFVVYAKNFSGDANTRNTRSSISYNGIAYDSSVFASYHISSIITVPLVKVAGQNSVFVSFGGSGTSQTWQSNLVQVN